MKTRFLLSSIPGPFRRTARWSATAAAAMLALLPVRAQVDNFDSGTDAGWTHFGLQAAGLPGATFSFPSDGYGGKAYRIFTPAPPVPDAGPARAFSYRKDVTYTDYYLAVDVVTFDNTVNEAFGFLVRASNIGLGATDGYVMNYDPNQSSGGHGQFQINSVTGEAPTTIAAANVTLDPTHRYRFVMTASADLLTGRVYDLDDLTAPIATISAHDSTYASGYVGLFNFSRVNAADYTNPKTAYADVTFDNFIATTPANAPSAVPFPGTVASAPGWPQVVNRVPASNANFYPASGGIAFDATTFSANAVNTNSILLILNGADVSNGLAVSGAGANAHAVLSGLVPNTAYNAAIVVSDSPGRSSTNLFSFDTFSEDFLNSPGVKVVEAEDYNFNSGQFQDNPPPSGLDANGNQVEGNGPTDGYYNLVGTPGIDYFDYDTASGGNDHLYRASDAVGTQAGSAEIESVDVSPAVLLNDTIRRQYAAKNLPEYEVSRTEGGEWLNYTRIFPMNSQYHVYLRVASTAAQHVRFDLISGDPSTTNQVVAPQGPFLVPNTGIRSTYRFVPLTDAQGNLKTIALGGTNTFRLTMADPRSDATKFTMALNYLVFVPAATAAPTVQLESAAAVTGPYSVETSAIVDTNLKTVTTSLPTSTRFYRLTAATALRIGKIQIAKANLVFGYQ